MISDKTFLILTGDRVFTVSEYRRGISIDGVDRSDFIIGAGISPLVSLQSINKADLNSDDPRMVSVKESIHSSLTTISLSALP